MSFGLGWRQPHYAALMQQRPALDFLEVHSENFFAAGGAAREVLRQARAHYPISLHGVGLSLGSAVGLDNDHLRRLAELVADIDPVRVSDHASFARAPWGDGRVVHAADLLPLPRTDAALDVLCANVQRVQERLRRPIAVENISAYLRWRPLPDESPWTEPEFLNALARRTGCQLLVDVNNLYVNACNAQLHDPHDDALEPMAACQCWLDAIDAATVAELHLAGHSVVRATPNGPVEIVIDDHGSRVCPAVWTLYAHALRRLGDCPTLIEWDTDLPSLDVLLDEVQRARALARSLADSHAADAPALIPA
ncbi:MAG: DUF692 domain-containing protein [Rhodoferax sp.]